MKDSDESKYLFSGYRIAFHRAVSRSFGNDFARHVVAFGVNNSSSYYINNISFFQFVL